MKIGRLRAREVCKTMGVGKGVGGRDVVEGIPSFQDRAEAVHLRFGLS